MDAQRTSGPILSIQYLRALAALGVVAFHAAQRAGLDFTVGAAGVDVFFVISGVVICVVTRQRDASPGAFLFDRVSRVAPAYGLLTLGVAAAALAAPALFPNLRVTPGHVLQSVLFIPHLDPEGRPWPLLVPGWTLTYEMFFYALFACALSTPPKARTWWCTAAIGGLALSGAAMGFGNTIGQTYTNPIMLEFVAGLWLGVAWTKGRLPGLWAGWAALLAGVSGFALASPWKGLPELLHWGVPAFLVVGGLLTIEARAGMPVWRAGLALGQASYSMYLVSGLAVSAAWRLAGHSVPAFLLASMIGTVAAGMAFSRTVELPATRKLRRLRWRQPAMA